MRIFYKGKLVSPYTKGKKIESQAKIDRKFIAKYTTNKSGVLPTFNKGYQYTVKETESNGVYTVKIYSNEDFTSCSFSGKTNLLTVEHLKVTNKVTRLDYSFNYCTQLTRLNGNNWDTSNVTDISNIFGDCPKLTQLNLSNWDISKVINMSYMFINCEQLTQLDLSNWDISDVANIGSMFYNCTSLNKILMNNSDYNSVNKIVAELLTRTTDSMGTLNITGIDDVSQIDINTLNSKYWIIISHTILNNARLGQTRLN